MISAEKLSYYSKQCYCNLLKLRNTSISFPKVCIHFLAYSEYCLSLRRGLHICSSFSIPPPKCRSATVCHYNEYFKELSYSLKFTSDYEYRRILFLANWLLFWIREFLIQARLRKTDHWSWCTLYVKRFRIISLARIRIVSFIKLIFHVNLINMSWRMINEIVMD